MVLDEATWLAEFSRVLPLALMLGCGFIAMRIAQRKHKSPGWFFLIGFTLTGIGVLIAVVVKPGGPRGPAHECPTCGAAVGLRVPHEGLVLETKPPNDSPLR